ncbi:MAG: AMP-binding protein [Steroidobacteraceae bacterium]
MLLPVERVARMASSRPGDPAIVDVRETGTVTWSWNRLALESQRVARLLERLGARHGDVIAYQLANGAEFVAITLGALTLGAICCPLMPIFRERELTDMLARARARIVIVTAGYRGRRPAEELASIEPRLPLLEHALVVGRLRIGGDTSAAGRALDTERASAAARRESEPALPRSARVTWQWLEQALEELSAPTGSATSDPAVTDPAALAQLLYTSGTSGEPKGVLQRQGALASAVALQIEHLGLGAQDRIYIPSPLAHQTGFLYGMWLALTLGVAQIVQETWNARRGLEALRESGGTFVQAATPFLSDLVDEVEGGAAPPTSLRIFVATGAAVPRQLARRASTTLRTAVCGAFGTTEGCLATLASPGDPPEKAWGTDGRPLRSIRIRIRDDAGRELGPGEEGHFETLSPTMFEGYLDRPDLTAAAYAPDGWYRTGDLAVIDADGFLHVTGRVKDVINRGGEKVPVAEIEQLLHQHHAVKEVAIVAMPDPRLGERACAFVVARPGSTLDFAAMQRFLDERRVAKPYWPERLEVLQSLPRTPSGKIQKFRLREHARSLVSPGGERP